MDKFTRYSFIQDNLAVGVFVYYFISLVVSRVGSLLIEPILKKISFVKFAPYADYISASKTDPMLETLSEVNNMYGTFCSMFVLLLLCIAYQSLEANVPRLGRWDKYIIMTLLLVTFLYSYRKQTEYVTKRIEANNPRSK